MRKQAGLTLIEVLIVIAIIGIIIAIAIPSLLRARISAVTKPFEKHFGVPVELFIDPAQGASPKWLSDDEKKLLLPLVTSRIQAVCVDPTSQVKEAQKTLAAFLEEPAAMEPLQAVVRLKRLGELTQSVVLGQHIADEGFAACQGAQDAAKSLGLLPQ